MLILAMMLGLVSDAISEKFDSLRKGRNVVVEQNHTLIIGWSDKLANMESIIRNTELTETRMMQALREELSSAERRVEEEHAAHNATKMAAMEREVQLEHRAVEASTVLARIQRIADERTAKAAELEQKVVLLEVECASLNQELQDSEAGARHGQKKSPEEANQMIQVLNEDLRRVVGQQERIINGANVWNSPVSYDKLGVRF